jgi:hypothetical protein
MMFMHLYNEKSKEQLHVRNPIILDYEINDVTSFIQSKQCSDDIIRQEPIPLLEYTQD